MKLFTSILLTNLALTASFVPKALTKNAFVLRAGIDGGGLNLVDKETSTLDSVNVGPDPIKPRTSGKTVLVSGLLQCKDRTDQTTFDFLKDNPLFSFEKIIAFCEDISFAKKRLTSRSARYSGLLDMLEFREGTNGVPTVEDLKDVDSHVAYGISEDTAGQIAENAAKAGVKNLVALMEAPASSAAVESVLSSLSSASPVSYTLLTVPSIVDGSEGKPYRVNSVTSDVGGTIPRDEALRIMTECLALDCASSNSYSVVAADTDEVAVEYLKDLRSKGYTRSQEIEKMLEGGIETFEVAVKEKEDEAAMKVKKEEEFKKGAGARSLSREEEIKQLLAKGKQEYKEMMEKKVKEEASDILRREWREKYFARNTSSPEEEYVAENMERGMKEAIRMIKMLKGEKLDDDEQEEHWMDREEREAREQEEKNPEPTEDPEPAPPAATKVEGGDGEGV
ncbi:hypothetical protein TrVE_jg13006 [Triparma verrucosa]|uniref:Uncharacterized protein n=1 Tax=Triparma verrucosa TaxID=1606542 RepID=A0A9W7B9A9_9STRA|nr:hypothetical protein TrVE_jg13006 [Triparma verrucosa]